MFMENFILVCHKLFLYNISFFLKKNEIILCFRIILSCVFLPWMKTLRIGEIILGIIFLSLLAKIFDIILYDVLQRLTSL